MPSGLALCNLEGVLWLPQASTEPCRWCQVPWGCSVGPEQLADWGFHPGQSGDLVHRAGCTPSRGHSPTLEPTKSACEEVSKLRGYNGPIRMVGCRDCMHTHTHTHTHYTEQGILSIVYSNLFGVYSIKMSKYYVCTPEIQTRQTAMVSRSSWCGQEKTN